MAQSNLLAAQLQRHLAELEQDRSVAFDEKLFEECRHFLAVQLQKEPEELIKLIVRLSGVLLNAQRDPAPVVRLLSKLVEPLSFSDVISLQPPIDFVGGLSREASAFNVLVLDLVAKAAQSPKDAAILAGTPNVVAALVKLWLSTADMGVADRASSIVLALLKVDKEVVDIPVHGVGGAPAQTGGQGLIWRRIFGDKDVYGLLYSLTSLADVASTELTKREKSIAQARLLSFIPPLGLLDWTYITRSHHSEIEMPYGLRANQGLLDFVSLHLVDYENDVLLHMNLVQFFTDLISTVKLPSHSSPQVSVSLEYLQEQKLHDRTMSFWLHPDDPSHDPVDLSFLYGPSAHYTAVYAQGYAEDLLAGRTLPDVLLRLSKALSISANQWAHGESPKHDLSVLSALPRPTLLPQPSLGTGRQSSPLFQVPSKVTNEDALHTLARILGGPRDHDGTPPDRLTNEAQTAPLLFHLYHAYHPTLFADLVTHADTVALPSKALAALTLLSSVVAANWAAGSPLASAVLATLPQPAASTLQTSWIPILLRQPARDAVLPYLLRAPRTFSNLVGGHGDTESAAYRIAMAKWDVLVQFDRKLGQWVPGAGVTAEELGLQAVKQAVAARVRDGVWGSGEQDVGGRIATLEL